MTELCTLPPQVVLQVLPALKDGGVEQSTIEMVSFLTAQSHTPLVAAQNGPKTPLAAQIGGRCFDLPMATKNPFVMIANAVRLVGIIRREKVTLVHARSRAPAWSAWAAARWCGVPYVATFHGTYGLRGGWLKRFYNSVMLRSPIAIANSLFIKQHIVSHYHFNPNAIVVAPRGIDPALWDPARFTDADRAAVRHELEVPEGVPLLLMVGRLSGWKGHGLLLRALACLPHDLKWVVAFAGGDEGIGAELCALAVSLGLSSPTNDRVRWLGSRKDAPRLLAASTLAFSCSTRPEAFGRVAIEAMAMGVPVIATALGGSLETIQDGTTGWLVKPETLDSTPGLIEGFAPQALADKIQTALQNPQALANMGQAARAHVVSRYTVDHCCRAEMLAYCRLLGVDTGLASKQEG